MAKTLIYDIETSYLVSGNWGIYDQNAATVLSDWQILCFAYKWLGEKKVHIVSMDEYPDYKPGTFQQNDYNVVKRLWELFNEADIIVAHNGNSFDQKKSQARMMIHGFDPPAPYKQIDTKIAMRRVAAHTSNKLSDLAKALEITHKQDAGGIDTWTGCMEGNPKAWKHMKKYNKYDVIVLEELYLKLRPWISNHPNVAALDEIIACPKCKSKKLRKKMKRHMANTGWKQQYQCMDCGGYVTGSKLHKPTDKLE